MQSAPDAVAIDEWVTVTMAVHPLRGSRLRVIRFERAQDGRRYVLAEHSRGWGIHLPEEWTDRGAPLSPPRLGKREAKLALDGLLQLTRAVDTLQKTSRVASQSVLSGAPTRGDGANAATTGQPTRRAD